MTKPSVLLFNEGHSARKSARSPKDQTTVLPLVERGKQGDVPMPDAALGIGIAHHVPHQIAKGNAIVMFCSTL